MKEKLPIVLFCMGLMGTPMAVYAQSISTGNITSVAADKKASAVTITLTGTLTTTGNSDFRQLRDLCYNMKTLNLRGASCPNIPKNALHSRHNLRSLTLPSNLKTIGSQAFFACDSLEGSLNIPASATSIGASCFAQCKKITSLFISSTSNLNNIGSYAFEGCESLAGEVRIPSKMLIIRDGVFANCKNLETVILHANLQSIGANAFSGCEKLSGNIEFGRMITRIGASAFAGCKSLSSVTMPRAIQQLGDAAFMDCSGLTGKITFPESLVDLGKGAFFGCTGIESVDIPESVQQIKAATFAKCTGLTSITLHAEEPVEVDETAFAGVDCKNVDLLVPEGSESKYQDHKVWKNFNIQGVATDVKSAVANGEVTVNVEAGILKVSNVPTASTVELFNVNGQRIAALQATGEATFTLPGQGVYVVSVNGKSYKVNY